MKHLLQNKFLIIAVVAIAGAIVYALPVEAQLGRALQNLDSAVGSGSNTGLQSDLSGTIGTIVKAALSLVGTIFLILTIYAGILWMTARGKEEQVEKAKEIIRATIIGLFITMSAYAITYFVGSRLGTQETGLGPSRLAFVEVAQAQDFGFGRGSMSGEVADKAGYDPAVTGTTLSETVGRVIKIMLSLVGMLFLVLTVYAGVLWMTARGAEDQITKAKDILRSSIIGLIITLGAYGITSFVVSRLTDITTTDSQVGDSGKGSSCPGVCVSATEAAKPGVMMVRDGTCPAPQVCVNADSADCEKVSGQICVDSKDAAMKGTLVPGTCKKSGQVCVEK